MRCDVPPAHCSRSPCTVVTLQVSLAEDGCALQSQPPGAIMAHHCIQFATMVQLSSVPPHANIPSLLALLARSAELSQIHIRCAGRQNMLAGAAVMRVFTSCSAASTKAALPCRRGEKKPLNTINTAKVSSTLLHGRHGHGLIGSLLDCAVNVSQMCGTGRPCDPLLHPRCQQAWQSQGACQQRSREDRHSGGGCVGLSLCYSLLMLGVSCTALPAQREPGMLLQVNEALNDHPHDGLLDFSMRSEVEQILTVGKRIAACMAK